MDLPFPAAPTEDVGASTAHRYLFQYKEWVYTAMTRATTANRLYVIAEPNHARDEFAPAEPARDGRMLLAAALMQSRADHLAIQHRIASRQTDRGIER